MSRWTARELDGERALGAAREQLLRDRHGVVVADEDGLRSRRRAPTAPRRGRPARAASSRGRRACRRRRSRGSRASAGRGARRAPARPSPSRARSSGSRAAASSAARRPCGARRSRARARAARRHALAARPPAARRSASPATRAARLCLSCVEHVDLRRVLAVQRREVDRDEVAEQDQREDALDGRLPARRDDVRAARASPAISSRVSAMRCGDRAASRRSRRGRPR